MAFTHWACKTICPVTMALRMQYVRVHIRQIFGARFARLRACLVLPIAILLGSSVPAASQYMPDAAAPANAAKAPAGRQVPAAPRPDLATSGKATFTGSELRNRFEALEEGLRNGEKTPADADAFYQKLISVLEARRQDLRVALDGPRSPVDQLKSAPRKEGPVAAPGTEPPQDAATVRDLTSIVVSLSDLRLQLLPALTPELRRRVTGPGLTGIHELRGEVETAILYLRYVALQMQDELAYWQARTVVAPLLLIGGVLELAVALFVFYWWRRWAAKAFPRWRGRLQEARPRSRRKLRLARFLWYLDEVRSPLEWLLLASVFFAVIGFQKVPDFENHIWPVPRWILLAWFVIALFKTIASRGGAGLLGDQAPGLCLRSLRLVAAWLLLLGFGLELARVYTGEGTFHAWVWGVFELLVLPVLLLLIIWWRPEVFRQLDGQQQPPEWVREAIRQQKGLRSYWGAAVGGVYLIAFRLMQYFLRGLSGIERGRRVLAALSRRGAERQSVSQGIEGGAPISAELRARLLDSQGKIYETAARTELAQLVELVEQGRVGFAAVIAEQGGGKSLLLQRLASLCEGNTVVFDCPPGGYEAFERAFASALGISGQELSPAMFAEYLQKSGTRAVAIDNFHRLVRPVMGGQKDLDRVSDLVKDIGVRALWVAALNQAAWDYISRARAHRLILDRFLELPPWTEEQIGELIDLRCSEAGVSPDFGQLVLPHQVDYPQDALEEQNREGIFRMIWDAADGNPSVAMRLWVDSLVVNGDGKMVVCMPPEPATREVEGVHFTVLLVLRIIIRAELVSREDIIESLRFSEGEVDNAMYFLLGRGWIEELNGRYRVSWTWFRAVTRVLARKNLLSR